MKFEKNENPDNILIIYTLLDENCHFQADPKKPHFPILDFYWLMGGKKFKPTNSIIKFGIRKKIKIDPSFKLENSSSIFPVLLNDLAEINSDFKDSKLIVHSTKELSKCKVTANLISNEKAWDNLIIQKIYSDSVKTFVPPFRRVISIRLDGIDPETGKVISKTYLAK